MTCMPMKRDMYFSYFADVWNRPAVCVPDRHIASFNCINDEGLKL